VIICRKTYKLCELAIWKQHNVWTICDMRSSAKRDICCNRMFAYYWNPKFICVRQWLAAVQKTWHWSTCSRALPGTARPRWPNITKLSLNWSFPIDWEPNACIHFLPTSDKLTHTHWLVAWRSGKVFHLINKVTLCRIELVLKRVTIYGQVNHLDTKPAS